MAVNCFCHTVRFTRIIIPAPVGRSHRSKIGKAKLAKAIEDTRRILGRKCDRRHTQTSSRHDIKRDPPKEHVLEIRNSLQTRRRLSLTPSALFAHPPPSPPPLPPSSHPHHMQRYNTLKKEFLRTTASPSFLPRIRAPSKWPCGQCWVLSRSTCATGSHLER
jgi:hypothetical protein